MSDLELFKEITKEMVELFEKKNNNYGNSFSKLYQEFGALSGLVPLHNKLERITSLVKGAKNNFESIEDSLIDLANYSIMLLIETKKERNNLEIKSKLTTNTTTFRDYHSGEEINGELLERYVDEYNKELSAKGDIFGTELW